jgi:Flp pilus assembly protein TadD
MADKLDTERELPLPDVIQQFEDSVKSEPNDARARFDLGTAYYVSGNKASAIKEFEKALEIAPSLDQAHYYLGVLYAMRGDKAAARKELEQVMNGSGQMMLKNQAKLRIGLLGV